MARIGLGVTGGISAYKAVEVARLLQKRGHDVHAILTKNARRFVGALTFEAITREPVITGQFAPGANAEIEHIALASTMDLLVVAPATANTLAKFAHGQADDFLSALHLATKAPVLIAPAMNTNMWDHPATQENLATLRRRGVTFVEPGDGYLACGWVGRGRLAEPEAIVDAVERRLASGRSLRHTRVLVTAGPTLEDIDAVRFIGNRSSGRMGFALAAAAQSRGAEVTLIAGPTAIEPPPVTHIVRVRSAADMHVAVMERAGQADVIIMAAAVADYTPASAEATRTQKIEKAGPLQLSLERTPDILADLGQRRAAAPRPVLVGFAAQTGDVERLARRKLVLKGVDLIVANDVSEPDAGFDVETNRVILVSAERSDPLPLMSKTEVAGFVLDRIEALLTTVAPVPSRP